MKKIFLPTSIVCLLAIFFALTSFKARSNKATATNAAATVIESPVVENTELSVEAASNKLYDSLHLDNLGLSREVMQMAYKGHQLLADQGEVMNEDIIAIADFSQSSSKKRLYVIDARNYRVLFNTYVAHGKNTGLKHAERFSNVPESLQSSLGFYVTKNTYFGKHGLSLRLEGLEQGFNDKAMERAIVMHGADYIGPNRVGAPYQGRSFGCPAVPQAESKAIINTVKDGTILFIYHPTQKYLNASKILNA